MVVIIDYSLGNVGSIFNMLKKIGKDVVISSDPKVIRGASKIILPGVGAFDNGMKNLEDLNLIEVLNETVLVHKIPILGICLGMQLMCSGSEEGKLKGLTWLPMVIKDFRNISGFSGTIPVMGWNYIKSTRENILIKSPENRFYFVHSFHCETNNLEILQTEINGYKYCAGFNKDNIFGVQFHPEKSHKFGVQLLTNFCNL